MQESAYRADAEVDPYPRGTSLQESAAHAQLFASNGKTFWCARTIQRYISVPVQSQTESCSVLLGNLAIKWGRRG
jgi:hypothetical protein